jgi:hypothetical protein
MSAIELVPLETFNSTLVVTCASEIKPEKVQWLWQERLPRGKCTLVAGEGGLGKSMVLAWIAANVSRGREWPCQEGFSPCGSVIILSAEDDAADTIVPRLMAADADCSKIHIVSAVRRQDEQGNRTFSLQVDLPGLERKIEEIGDVLLVIIDPISSYLGGVDSHKNAELRSVLEPLGEMASRLKVTVIANTHLSKASSGSANSRVIGSVAFVNHARAAFIVTADPDDQGRRFFLPSKTNLGRPREGLAYRIADTTIVSCDDELIWAPYVQADYAWTVLMLLLAWARGRGITAYRPPGRIKRLYHTDRSEKIWEDHRISAFMAVSPLVLQWALVLAADTGQRQGDLLVLPWTAFDPTPTPTAPHGWITLRQSKTGRRVRVPVTSRLRAVLNSRNGPEGEHFLQTGCKPEGLRRAKLWRPRPESNRGARICSPLRHHSATWPIPIIWEPLTRRSTPPVNTRRTKVACLWFCRASDKHAGEILKIPFAPAG